MIIVDDKLSLDALAGRFHQPEPMSTTWSFHYRLVKALREDSRSGYLGRAAEQRVRAVVDDPPPALLQVLDPRIVTAPAADVARRHGINLLASELIASAVYHRAAVYLSARNVGRQWVEIMAAEGVALTVV